MVLGCLNNHTIYNKTTETAVNILTDNCNDEYGDDWLVSKGANNTESEVILHMGCTKQLKGLRMKNIKKENGGTKIFSIYLANSLECPWKFVLADEFQEHENFGCAPMQIFDLQ